MNQTILEKRTSEAILYDMDCTALLSTGETISSITTVSSDQPGLTFGAPNANSSVINYDDGTTAAVGTVIQVKISAGVITSGASQQVYTIRAVFQTSTGNTREATVLLRVVDVIV